LSQEIHPDAKGKDEWKRVRRRREKEKKGIVGGRKGGVYARYPTVRKGTFEQDKCLQ
jgi:hypothetical protein